MDRPFLRATRSHERKMNGVGESVILPKMPTRRQPNERSLHADSPTVPKHIATTPFCAKPLTRANNVAIRAERLKNLNNSVFTIDRTEDTCRPPRFREWKTPRRRSNSVPFRFGFNIDIYKLGIYYNYRVTLSSREPIYSEQSYTGMTDDDENLESSYSRRRLKPALGVRIR